jgi:hypothetical protein
MTSRVIIGLDVSTSCTGICCLDDSGKILKIDPIVLTKAETFSKKCNLVAAALENTKQEFLITDVFIEQNLSSFRRGLSSAHTINTLARFNGACSLITYQIFGVEPVLLNVTNARNHVGLKMNHKDKTVSTKEKVFTWVSSQVEVDWPVKKSGEKKEISYDMADAYVIALAGLRGCKE